jgi:DNA replication protein DnaC
MTNPSGNPPKGNCVFCGVATIGLLVDMGIGNPFYFPAPECCSSSECLSKNDAKFRRAMNDERRANQTAKIESCVERIPPIYRDTAYEKLNDDAKVFASTWTPLQDSRKHSLLITGKSRSGKSRTAAYIAERLALDNGLEVEFMTMFDFERAIEEGITSGSHSKNISRMCKVPYLVLDDIGKEMLTKRVASDIFAVIDTRVSYKRTTIITTQHTGTEIASRFNDRTLGEAIVARLREFYTIASI